MRTTAAAGDEIFLQARVYNYSLDEMEPDARVYARFCRQQLDVNNDRGAISVVDYAADGNGAPLPAVPIGTNGLGDSEPVAVVAPSATTTSDNQDNTATLWPFNNTSDPKFDNISLATVSYVSDVEDTCEYDGNIQNCDGAYYAYWVVVWAEDSNGLVRELAGHNLGPGFDPTTSYDFITDVPLEMAESGDNTYSFTNNVGMFKLVFSIVPKQDPSVAAPVPGTLALDKLNVSRDKTMLGEPVVVSGRVSSHDGPSTGHTVAFYDGDPEYGRQVFDVEWLPTIRVSDSHFVRAVPLESVLVGVGIDYVSTIDYLKNEVWRADLDMPGHAGKAHKKILTRQLRRAEAALDRDRVQQGVAILGRFNNRIERLTNRMRLSAEEAEALLAQTNKVIGCVL